MSIRSNIDARRLDQRVNFERNTPARTATGGETPNWASLCSARAAVDAAKVRSPEPSAGDETLSQSDYTVWVRAEVIERHAITVADRIRWKRRVMDIKDILDQQRRGRLLPIICRSGVNDG